MNTENQDIEMMEGYFHGKLSPIESAAFENRLQSDPDFTSDYQLFLAANRAIEMVGVERDRAQLTELLDAQRPLPTQASEPPFSQKPNRITFPCKVKWGKCFGIAASITLLAVFSVLFFQGSASKGEKLYAKHFEPYPDLVTGMAPKSKELSTALGMQAYNAKDWEAVIYHLSPLPSSTSKYSNLQVYLGIAYMEKGDGQKAEDCFEQVVEFGPKELESAALWYLGLAKLRQNQVQEALEAFEEVTKNGSGVYGEKARAVLVDLE